MSKRMFAQEQINELLKNENVFRCSEKSITYHRDFKIKAVRQYQDEGLSAMQIFKQAGFNIATIGRKTPKHCLQDWRGIFKAKGEDGFVEQRGKNGKGGGRPPFKNLTDQEKIKTLELQNAYLKAKNSFLVKLRAKQKR